MAEATFNATDHTVTPGYATYMQTFPKVSSRLRRKVCQVLGHKWPEDPPEPSNGFSPSNYVRCPRCRQMGHWFVRGQHRFGSYDQRVSA